jgi:transposase
MSRRPTEAFDGEAKKKAIHLWAYTTLSVTDVAERFEVDKSTISRLTSEEGRLALREKLEREKVREQQLQEIEKMKKSLLWVQSTF